MQSTSDESLTKKPEQVQSWENEGGALPDPVVFHPAREGLFEHFAERALKLRRKLGRVVLRNPELALGAALSVGVLLGVSSRRAPLLKLLLGALATAKTRQFIQSIATTPNDS